MAAWPKAAIYGAVALAACASIATAVYAMTVSPVVIDLQTSGQRMSQVVTIENKYAKPVILEVLTQEATYTDDGVRGTGKATDDLLVFPPQAQIPAGGTQAIRIQYVGDPDLVKSKHYFVTVAQLPVKIPEGDSAVQLLYNFQIVTGVSMAGKRPNIAVAGAASYAGGDGKPRVALTLKNDADTYGYLSNGSLRIVQKDSAGKEIFRKSMTGEQISQEIGFGLVGAGQLRTIQTAIILPDSGAALRRISLHRNARPAPSRTSSAILLGMGGLSFAHPALAGGASGPAIAISNPGLLTALSVNFDDLLLEAPLAQADAVADSTALTQIENPPEYRFFADEDAAPARYAVKQAVDLEAEPGTRLNPTGRDITLSAPLRDGAFVLNEVGFILAADDTIKIEAKSFIEAVRPVISPERLFLLQSDLAGAQYVAATQIERLGYIIRYDPASISLNIQIPAEARSAQDISLRRFEDSTTGTFYEPATVSGYINFRSFGDYVWSGIDSGFQSPTALIDSAIRYKGVVLENEATLRLDSDAQQAFTREGTRLVYDDRRRLVRFAAGDLITSGRGFSGSPQIAGLSATRVYSIVDPLRNVQPRGDRSFTLTRPATVEAMINGQLVRRVRLQPGVYNIRDFPLFRGTNNVEFNIQDDAGGIQRIAFSQFFDRTLLAAGLTEFSLQAGILAPFRQSSRDYQTGNPAASGWIRRGINDALTLGGNFNVNEDGVAAGVEAVFASSIGILGVDAAVSDVDGIGTGFAANVGLQKSFGGYESTPRSIAAAVEYRSENFANPGFAGVDNRIAWNLSASYAQPIGRSQFVSVSGDYGIARGPFSNEASARLTYGYNINPRLNLTIDATYEDRPLFGNEYGVRATLFVKFGPRSNGVAEIDTRTERARIGYQTGRGEGVGSWTASGDLDVGTEDVGFNGGFNYTANRAELGLTHTTVYELSGRRTESQRTSLRLGTAIAFADGKFALSRPIYDSFAMVAPHKSLKGADVYIDPREDYYTAKSGAFGPAVEPNLGAYIRRTLTYDVPQAPVGYDLGTASAKLLPPYRGGYLVVAGSDYSVTTLGTLIGADGAPVSLLSGKTTEIGGANPRTLTIFTNRTGRFGISGMRPGRWRIEMPTEPPTVVEIEIPENANGVVRLGEVRLGDAQ